MSSESERAYKEKAGVVFLRGARETMAAPLCMVRRKPMARGCWVVIIKKSSMSRIIIWSSNAR